MEEVGLEKSLKNLGKWKRKHPRQWNGVSEEHK